MSLLRVVLHHRRCVERPSYGLSGAIGCLALLIALFNICDRVNRLVPCVSVRCLSHVTAGFATAHVNFLVSELLKRCVPSLAWQCAFDLQTFKLGHASRLLGCHFGGGLDSSAPTVTLNDQRRLEEVS